MGTIATAFTNAFVDNSAPTKANARALGSTIETFLAAPYTLNNNATASPTSAPTGYVMRVIGKDADTYQMVTIDSFGGIPSLRLRRANGTGGAATAVLSGDNIGEIEWGGYTGAAYDAEGVTVQGAATENWSGSAQGSQIIVYTTPNTTATQVAAAWFGQDQSFRVSGAFGNQSGVGAGSSITQGAGSGKSTAVTLSKVCGQITMNGALLSANTTVSFTLTNTFIAATDILLLQHTSGGTQGSYNLTAAPGAGGATIFVRNVTAGNLSEAIVISFAVIKSSIT
jgi:hypothetical protein